MREELTMVQTPAGASTFGDGRRFEVEGLRGFPSDALSKTLFMAGLGGFFVGCGFGAADFSELLLRHGFVRAIDGGGFREGLGGVRISL